MARQVVTLIQVCVRAGVTVSTVLRDMEKELLSDLSSHGHEWINLFSEGEVINYLKYRSTLTRHKPPVVTSTTKRERNQQIAKSVRRIGAEATAIKFGIKLESLKRNLRNWQKEPGRLS